MIIDKSTTSSPLQGIEVASVVISEQILSGGLISRKSPLLNERNFGDNSDNNDSPMKGYDNRYNDRERGSSGASYNNIHNSNSNNINNDNNIINMNNNGSSVGNENKSWYGKSADSSFDVISHRHHHSPLILPPPSFARGSSSDVATDISSSSTSAQFKSSSTFSSPRNNNSNYNSYNINNNLHISTCLSTDSTNSLGDPSTSSSFPQNQQRRLSGRRDSISSIFSEDSPYTITAPGNGTPSLLTTSKLSSSGTGKCMDRPPTAEKARWLARINLLLSNSNNSNSNNSPNTYTDDNNNNNNHIKKDMSETTTRINKIADDDDNAMYLAIGNEKFVYIEYMHWMGTDIFNLNMEQGEIKCYGCNKLIGVWTWLPNEKYVLLLLIFLLLVLLL
jgi:hypothetical protein